MMACQVHGCLVLLNHLNKYFNLAESLTRSPSVALLSGVSAAFLALSLSILLFPVHVTKCVKTALTNTCQRHAPALDGVECQYTILIIVDEGFSIAFHRIHL